MARTNNLTNFLTDVSAAIKQKTGGNTPIPASDFDTEILSIETAGSYQTKSLSVTTNGNYQLLPDTGYDAMDQVNISVNVPSENLDSVITTQEEKLNELERVLLLKGSWEVIPNIYVQEMEPLNKNGIWLKMSDNTDVENFISDDNIFIGGTWALDSETANIPYSFYQGSVAVVGTDIYLLGGFDGSGYGTTYNYKYNTLTNTYTRLANIPYSFHRSAAASVGTNIYLFGNNDASKQQYNYKYDTLTNTYTQMANIPYSFRYGSAISIGTDIYLFGSYTSSAYNYAYKYNTLTNTYSRLTNIPYNFYQGSVVSIGTSIYLLGGNTSKNNNYKYDTLTDIWTQMTNIPYNFYNGGAEAVGTDIYIFGGDSNKTAVYKYNTLTDTYTQLTNIPYNFSQGASASIGTNIYLLGGTDNKTNNRIFYPVSKTYETDNSVVIAQGRTYDIGYNTKLFETPFDQDYQPLYGFADAYFYTIQDGLDGSMPVYYGDGTQWINIKNPPTEGGNE